MKHIYLMFAFTLYPGFICASGFHFGMPSAVKAKVAELDKKVAQERIRRVQLGISPLPKGPLAGWIDSAFTEVYQKSKEGGIDIAVWRPGWGEIETSIGVYDWTSNFEYQVTKTSAQGLKLSLVIEITHSNIIGTFPAGLAFSKFDDPAFIAQFKLFLRALFARYPGKISYLWLGNEADIYLKDNPAQVTPYLNFCKEAVNEIRSIDPSVTTGLIGAYHSARSNNQLSLLREFSKIGDAIGLTVYMEQDVSNPPVSQTQSYYDGLMGLFGNTKVCIIETAWSSRGAKGSDEIQNEYIQEISKVLIKYSKRLTFFSFLMPYDFDPDVNKQIVASFGIDVNNPAAQPFLLWHGSLGLLNADGTEKPAWRALKTYIAR